MTIRTAVFDDTAELLTEDRWISPEGLQLKISAGQILVLETEGRLAGLLRYGLFWDSIPFMNLLRVREDCRGLGYGTQLVLHWEQEMKGEL